jgi:beta-galactosidase
MDIGEHPGCNRGEIFIYTNADSVKMYKNDVFIKEYTNGDSPYKHLKHGPIRVDDYIGSTLEENEKMSHKQAETVKSLLNDVARVGLYGMTKSMYLKAGKCMLLYGMKMEDAVALFNKYIGNWGGTSTAYKFEAIKNGNVVKTTIKTPMTKRVLQTNVSHTELKEDYTYDVALVRISLTDEYGNVLPFANDALVLKCEGCIELIGPEIVSLQGGMFGTYVKTTGEAGKGRLTITTATGEYKKIDFNVTI